MIFKDETDRADFVARLAALARYPWSGHAALLGRVPRPWQGTREVLGRSGRALGSVLGVHPQAVYKAARRGATHARRWERLLGERR